MGLLTTLALATTYVILLAYTTPTSTIASPNVRSFQGRKLEFSGNMAAIPSFAASGSAKNPDDDIVQTANRRQSRIVDDYKFESNMEDTRPMEIPPSVSQKERIVYVERRPVNMDLLDDDRLNSFSQARRPEIHPDGDILTGRRERPYDDPVGLQAQREEIQIRNNNDGGSFFSNWFSRATPNRPRTSEDYLLPSEPSRHTDNMPFLPPPTEQTGSRTRDVVGSILRALLN